MINFMDGFKDLVICNIENINCQDDNFKITAVEPTKEFLEEIREAEKEYELDINSEEELTNTDEDE